LKSNKKIKAVEWGKAHQKKFLIENIYKALLYEKVAFKMLLELTTGGDEKNLQRKKK